MSSTAQLASHRQTLYFASLHCQQLAGGESLQQRQCVLEAATECLYRSAVFLAQHLLEQSAARVTAKITHGHAFASWPLQMQSEPAQDPALQRLVTAFSPPNPLAELLVAYQVMWQPANTQRSADHLTLVDTSVSLASCIEWHSLLEGLAAECIAMQSEY